MPARVWCWACSSNNSINIDNLRLLFTLFTEDPCTFLHILHVNKTLKTKQTQNHLLVMLRTNSMDVLTALVLWWNEGFVAAPHHMTLGQQCHWNC